MVSRSYPHLSFTVVLTLFLTGTRLDAKSITVDDADTRNITYSPGWVAGNNCTGCLAQPDKTQTFDGTWHDVTASGAGADIFFTFAFTGTSIEARHIALDIIETDFVFTTGTNVSYSIDGVQRGTAVRNPANLNTYAYNQILFNVTGLPNAEHILRVDLLRPSVLLLDYLVYDDEGGVETSPTVTTRTTSSTSLSTLSTPNSTASTNASSKPSTNLGPIIGGVVAGVIVVVLGGILVWYLKRRNRGTSRRARRSLLSEDDAPPFLPPPFSIAEATKTGENSKPQQPASGHTTNNTPVIGLNSSGEPLIGASLIPRRSAAMTNPGSLPEAYQPPNVNEKPPAGIPQHPVQGTTTSGVPPSSFYNGSVASLIQAQIPDEPVEAGQTFEQPQPPPGHTANYTSSIMGSNLSRETAIGTHLAPTLPPSWLAMTDYSNLPSDSKVYQGRHIDAQLPEGAPRYSVQGTATNGAPPRSFYNEVVENRVQARASTEQVEEGLMTRHPSMMSTLPPYSPGEFQWDDDMPPLPD